MLVESLKLICLGDVRSEEGIRVKSVLQEYTSRSTDSRSSDGNFLSDGFEARLLAFWLMCFVQTRRLVLEFARFVARYQLRRGRSTI